MNALFSVFLHFGEAAAGNFLCRLQNTSLKPFGALSAFILKNDVYKLRDLVLYSDLHRAID